jgi:hypothetical protein
MTTIHKRLLLLAAVAGLSLSLAHAGFRNVRNTRFATRASGPQGAIVVPHYRGQQTPANQQGLETFRRHNPNLLQRAVRSYAKIERLGLKRHRADLRFPRTLVHTLEGAMIQTDLQQVAARAQTFSSSRGPGGRRATRGMRLMGTDSLQTAAVGDIGDPGNNLTFQYEGWSVADQSALAAYLTTAYPKAKLIYGPPAFNLTVKIIQDATLQTIQGGIYDVTSNEIRIPPLSGNFPEDTYVLLMLVLNAFHDDAILYYDCWEQGLIGAAAYIVQTQPGVSPGYDPIDPGPFYCLSVYEAENQPELGNSTFYPTSGATNMLIWRLAMARAVWLKCYIENNNFFRDFNAAYYASYSSELAGDIPSLKELAAGAVPTVEGMPFVEWYQHQYVLDTSNRVGKKLYTWNIPLDDAVPLIAELYETLADGDENPLGGNGYATYWNYQYNIQLYAENADLLSIPSGGATPGEGYILPVFFNIGGPQRITVQLDIADLRREYPFPYGERGFDPGTNNLYGAIIGEDAGTIDVTGGDGLVDVPVSRGVWGGRITTANLSPRQIRVTFTNGAGQSVSRLLNIGWDSYVCFLESSGQAAVSHDFPFGRNGLYLMSLPLKPTNPNLPEVLGVALDQLLLAWWDPWLAGTGKYRLWPQFPFESPGQAYWWRVPQDTTVNLTGLQADPALPFEVPLGVGWNLVGCPRLTSVNLADVQVRQGAAEPVTWAQATTNRLLQNSLYSYSQDVGYELKDAFVPWEGFWMRCLIPTGVTLIFPPTE